MTLILQNPRKHVLSASIHWDGTYAWISYKSQYGMTYSDACKSVTSAKSLFSRNVLSPRFHGKNVWKPE